MTIDINTIKVGTKVKIVGTPCGLYEYEMNDVGLSINGYGYTVIVGAFNNVAVSAEPIAPSKYSNGVHGWYFDARYLEYTYEYDPQEWNID